jgi:hypothetical protein
MTWRGGYRVRPYLDGSLDGGELVAAHGLHLGGGGGALFVGEQVEIVSKVCKRLDTCWLPALLPNAVNTGSTWSPGVNLGSTWGHPGVNLGSTWGQLGVNLWSTWGQPGVNLGSTSGQPALPYLGRCGGGGGVLGGTGRAAEESAAAAGQGHTLVHFSA